MQLTPPNTFYADTRKYCEFLSRCKLAGKNPEIDIPRPPKNTSGTELTYGYFTVHIDNMSLEDLEIYKKMCLTNEQNSITQYVDNKIDTLKIIQEDNIKASMMQLAQ